MPTELTATEATKPQPLHVVLVHPEIPQNTGNIGRTCVAVGAKLWLVRPLGFRMDDRHLQRVGLDYWEHLDWQVVDNWDELRTALPTDRMWFFTKRAERLHTEVEYAAGDVLVFGSETSGLPHSVCQPQRPHALRIPMRAEARSLNLASSVAVAAYEAVRQIS